MQIYKYAELKNQDQNHPACSVENHSHLLLL